MDPNIHMIADVTATSMEDGDVRVNLGNSITNEGEAADAPWLANGDGFVSRPNDPDGDGACEAVYLRQGNQKVCVAAKDGRYASKGGELQPGDRAIVSRGEARFLLKAETDNITLYTANQQDDDSSMMVSLNGSTGKGLLVVGTAYIELENGKLVLSNGQASIVLDGPNIQVFGSHTALNTKTGNLGVVGTLPPPTGVNSITAGVSGMTALPSPGWTVTTAP